MTSPQTHSRGSTDNTWAPLVGVRSFGADGNFTAGVVRVGERPVWDLDAGSEVVWWMQRLVIVIERIPSADFSSDGRVQAG